MYISINIDSKGFSEYITYQSGRKKARPKILKDKPPTVLKEKEKEPWQE